MSSWETSTASRDEEVLKLAMGRKAPCVLLAWFSHGTANASAFFTARLRRYSSQRTGEEEAMSDQLKTLGAYIVALSILMFAWSVFKTWEPPIQARGPVRTETLQTSASANTVLPTQVAAE